MNRLLPAAPVLVMATLSLLWASPAIADDETPFVVIVHPSSGITSIDRIELTKIFMGKTTKWPNGKTTRPVDQRASSKVRRAFSQSILGQPVSQVKNHWYEVLLSGRGTPPPEKSSDRSVVKYILATPGAVGYVAAGTDLKGAKVIKTTD